MTYQEAKKEALKVRWKIRTCNMGEKCWCRTILLETPIENDDEEEIYILGSGSIDNLYAKHIVDLHNNSLLKDS